MDEEAIGKLAGLAIDGARARKRDLARKRRAQTQTKGLAGQRRAPRAPEAVRIPITITLAFNDYTAEIKVGSDDAVVNVILDTGSSTFAVDPKAYDSTKDADLVPTTFAQIVRYEPGGWAGPVVRTSIEMGSTRLRDCPMAIASLQQPGNFHGATGVLGLAYSGMNEDYDMQSHLATHGGAKSTYPWALGNDDWATDSQKLLAVIQSEHIPAGTLTSWFDQLEGAGIVANKFAFHVRRSWISVASADPRTDPLNQGVFVLGGGEDERDLFDGAFRDVAVLDDVFYNTNLVSVRVGDLPAVAAAPLPAKYLKQEVTNSVIDTGTNELALAADVYDAVMAGLEKLNPRFTSQLQEAQKLRDANQGMATSDLDLASWPDIHFNLTGADGGDVELVCKPSTYWQVDFPAKGAALFQIGKSPEEISQTILGLPLLNNYYTVFDRSKDVKGILRFAPIK